MYIFSLHPKCMDIKNYHISTIQQHAQYSVSHKYDLIIDQILEVLTLSWGLGMGANMLLRPRNRSYVWDSFTLRLKFKSYHACLKSSPKYLYSHVVHMNHTPCYTHVGFVWAIKGHQV